jgi:hypothetical protein
MELLHWTAEPPALRRPVLLVALDGFVDAGAVASTAAMFLRHRWRSEPIATFDREALIDYRARRPTIVVDSGRLRRLEWPEIELLTATVEGPNDAALLLGPEPDMLWGAFSAAVAEVPVASPDPRSSRSLPPPLSKPASPWRPVTNRPRASFRCRTENRGSYATPPREEGAGR